MVRRLLSPHILRTRSARKILVGGSVIVLHSAASTLGCDPSPPKPEAEPPPLRHDIEGRTAAQMRELEREFEDLQAEAGIETPEEPPAPSGDLRQDIESFTTLDACVRARPLADPLLGDAIAALGYDSLTRDACRILQALRAKRTDACKPIVASPLRAECESSVAVLTGNPSLCPATSTGGGLIAREPVCLARASRDERLCMSAVAADRPKCKALVLGRASECGRDTSCVRQVERYKSLLEKPVSRPPLTARLRIDVAEPGSTEPPFPALDLDDEAAGGAILNVTRERVRISLGTPRSASWLAPDSPLASPKVFIEFSVPVEAVPASADVKKKAASLGSSIELGPTDLRVDLLLPKVTLLSALMASDRTVDIQRLSTEPGGPIKFVLAATLREAPRVFRVKFDVETFVRERTDQGEQRP